MSVAHMKNKTSDNTRIPEDDIRPDYDFKNMKGAVRGKYYKAGRQTYTVRIRTATGATISRRITPAEDAVFLDQDVREFFPDSESVNTALRGLVALLPHKRSTKAVKRAR